ncbi:MAG TPA: serine/threonine-protein kinase [Gemmatimonadales bacterium]|nr:serine/threonine-protein kinase [Gemmatimonadales bacterium]
MADPAAGSIGYLAPGTVLRGRYRIGRELGRGGYSVVYLARDSELELDVAIKLLVPPPAAAQVARERMRREVQAVRGLSHGGIVAVYDFLEDGPWSFIIMEYVAGPDLQVRVRQRGPLDPEAAVRLGRDVAAALSAAHRHGILHRDVKPQNILLDRDGRARLTDFGSARLDGQLGVTGTGALAGTLAYSAPEVLAGRRGDARADVYALGLTLYYALAGDLPGRPSPHLPPSPEPAGWRPRAGAAAVPGWLDDIVARATAAAAEDRFPTAAALEEALAHPDAPGAQATEGLARCVLCTGPDPLGLGLCPACGGSGDVADTLVFLRRGETPTERRSAALRLAAVLPDLDRAGARAAAEGRRPVFRVPRAGVDRLQRALEQRELTCRARPVAGAWAALPGHAWLTTGAVITAGALAGSVAMPFLLWTTPVVGSLLLLGARRDAGTPLMASPAREAALPAALERTVVETLTSLPPGTARSLLADVVRSAGALFAALARTGDERRLADPLAELVTAACAAARDLSDLDENLVRFERQREQLAAADSERLDALSRSERTRDALVQRLLEGLTVVARLRTQQAELAGEADPGLGELAADLRREAEAQAAAARELEALLRA